MPSPNPRSRTWRLAGILASFIAAVTASALPLAAHVLNLQWVGIPKPQPPPPGEPGLILGKRNPNAQMLVQASEIQYDHTNSLVTAVGNVQIYYNGSTLEADRVIYDQKTKRLHAEGNARLTEPDGKVVYGDTLDLNDEFRDGFVDALRLETPDKTRGRDKKRLRPGNRHIRGF